MILAAACAPRGAQPVNLDEPELVAVVPAGSAAQALQAAAAAYAQRGGGRVQVEVIGGDAYQSRVSAALLAGSDRYDLVLLPGSQLPRWVRYHALRPLDDPADEPSLLPWVEGMRFGEDSQSKFYGFPTQPDPLVLWYRVDLFSSVPGGIRSGFADWQAFREAASRLNAPPSHYGAAIAGGEFDAGMEFAAVLEGSDMAAMEALTERGEVTTPAVRALELLAGLTVADGVTSADSQRYTREDVIAALATGKAAMGLAPLSAGEELLDCSIHASVCQGGYPLLVSDLLPGPGRTDCSALSGISAWAVPLKAAHSQAAQHFLAWLVSTEGARAWSDGGGIPAHREVLGSPLLPMSYAPPASTCTRAVFGGLPNADQAWKALHAAAHAAITEQHTPEQALDTAAAEIRKALRQSGMLK